MPKEVKSTGTAYAFWCIGLIGLCGVHRFYLNRPLTGLLWICTGGLCWIGQIVDLFLIPEMVESENEET